MSCILNIETSTSVCSVAASQDGQTIFVKEDLKGPSHAVSLGVFVDEALSFIFFFYNRRLKCFFKYAIIITYLRGYCNH